MRSKRTYPPKIDHLLSVIKKSIDTGSYRQRIHARIRGEERNIELADVKYVLKNGQHETVKTQFDEIFNTWKYAIRGKTLDGIDMRVIVAFDQNIMHIITVINLTNG